MRLRAAAAAVTLILLAGCQNANQIAMKVGAPPDTAVKLRALESRRFDTLDESNLLAAATQTLQDLGYTISESSNDGGVIVGAKQRNAEEAGQIAAQVILTVLLAAAGSYHQPVWDKDQTISVTLVTTPIENSKQVEVRVAFDRKIRNTQGQWRAELIEEPKIYQEFFEKLSAGAFLEAHQL